MSGEPISVPAVEWPPLEHPEQLDRIIDVIAKEGAIDRAKVVPGATLETLGLASMDVVMILTGIEEELDTYIPMSIELSSASNLAEFVASVSRAMKKTSEQTETIATS